MICKKCLSDKDSSKFYKNSNSKTGYAIYCKKCCSDIQKDFYEKNKEKVLERKKKYRNTETYKTNNRNYELRYKEVRKRKRSENFKIKLGMVLRDMVRRCLMGQKKHTSTFKLLGYDVIKLKQRIEIQFKDGMCWDNYGKWHIDHKKPISKFDDNTKVSTINALSNLQPLWAKDNLSKGNKF
jgi:hypothetical protein